MHVLFVFQFSCAAPIDGLNANGHRDVWVCNSDGYVGHMCLLSLQPEPIVTLNTPVPGCNARILCIAAVPSHTFFRRWACFFFFVYYIKADRYSFKGNNADMEIVAFFLNGGYS